MPRPVTTYAAFGLNRIDPGPTYKSLCYADKRLRTNDYFICLGRILMVFVVICTRAYGTPIACPVRAFGIVGQFVLPAGFIVISQRR
jgi:hypothetical protein